MGTGEGGGLPPQRPAVQGGPPGSGDESFCSAMAGFWGFHWVSCW